MILFRSKVAFKAIMKFCSSVLTKLVGLFHSLHACAKFNLKNKLIKLSDIFTFIFMILILINLVLIIYETYSHFYNYDYLLHVLSEGVSKDLFIDHFRLLSSGVPQSVFMVGFKPLGQISVSPRLGVLLELLAIEVVVVNIAYQSAIEKSLGFNRYLWGLRNYRTEGVWSNIDEVATKVSDKTLIDFVSNEMKNVDQSKVEAIVNEVIDKGTKSFSFSDISNHVQILFDYGFNSIMRILNPVEVQGIFDDLIGQRFFIEVILFILCLLIIILFFIMNKIFILNIDKIKNRFKYFNFQIAICKITLVYVSILYFIGLFTIYHGLHWLIVNQISYENLDVDLHTLKSSKSIILGMTLTFKKLKFSNFIYFISQCQ